MSLFGAFPRGAVSVAQQGFQDLLNGNTAVYRNPGLLQTGNINLNQRPVVHNRDGSISTVRSMSANFDGVEYLIPTVSDDGRVMDENEAIRTFLQTGRHLGAFRTPSDATSWARQLHEAQARQYGKGD